MNWKKFWIIRCSSRDDLNDDNAFLVIWFDDRLTLFFHV